MTPRMKERIDILIRQMNPGRWYRMSELGMFSWANGYRQRVFQEAYEAGLISRRIVPGQKPGQKRKTFALTDQGVTRRNGEATTS